MAVVNERAVVSVFDMLGRSVIKLPKVLGGATLTQLVQKLFANNEQGFFYDPNDLSTMFQDAAGTVPVTGAGQPVGLMLDKSRGLNFLPYIVDQKNFTDLSGWFVSAAISAEVVAGEVELTCGGSIGSSAANWFRPALANQVISYSVWEMSFDATHVSGGSLQAGAGYGVGLEISPTANEGTKKRYTALSAQFPANPRYPCVFGGALGAVWRISNITCRQLAGNHAGQFTSAARPILQDTPRRIDFDAVDDKLITNLPAQLTGCTVIRSVPNVGTQILTDQTIPATYEDSTDHCGLLVINRALTPSETSAITSEFNKRAGV